MGIPTFHVGATVNSNRRLVHLLAVAFVVAACTSKESPSNAPAASANATPPPAATAPTAVGEPTANDVSNYELTMDRLRKWAAAVKGFQAASRSDSAAAAAMRMDQHATTAQMIASLENNPVAKRVLDQVGLSARDYVWTTAAYMQAAMMAGVMQMPNAKAPEGMNMRNVEFVRTHKTALDAMMKEAGMMEGR